MLIELKKGESFTNTPVILSTIEIKQGRNGNSYADLSVMDKSTVVNAKMWNTSTCPYNKGDIVNISGKVDEFNGTLQLILNEITDNSNAKVEDLLKSSLYDKDTLWSTINSLIVKIKDDDCRRLVENVFEKYKEKFENKPAAKTVHHNYLHGLLEHSCFVTINAVALAQNYSFINTDLLITSALLHDIGKIEELTDMPSIDYSVTGNLLGHIAIGTIMLSKEMDALGFAKDKHDKVIHCILAHHGKLEYGSPKTPIIPEAMILNLADDCDAKMKIFEEAIRNESKEKNFFLGAIPMSGKFEGELNFI